MQEIAGIKDFDLLAPINQVNNSITLVIDKNLIPEKWKMDLILAISLLFFCLILSYFVYWQIMNYFEKEVYDRQELKFQAAITLIMLFYLNFIIIFYRIIITYIGGSNG